MTYQIRGACFKVWEELGSAFKEFAYQKALALELEKRELSLKTERSIKIIYEGKEVGRYRPDFVVEGKVLVEIKIVPFLAREHKLQFWRYLKGSSYKVGFLVNFGGKRLEIIRRVYDTARLRRGARKHADPRGSA